MDQKTETYKRKIMVTMIMAMSADGKVGVDSYDPVIWTGSADKKMFKDLTTKAGVVIMGRKTYNCIGGPLKNRFNVVMTSDLNHIIKHLPETKWFVNPYSDFCKFERGYTWFAQNSPESVIEWLELKGFDDVYLIGGPTINTAFMKSGLVDMVMITVCPKFFGSGLSMFTEQVSLDLELIEGVDRLTVLDKDTVSICYSVKKK